MIRLALEEDLIGLFSANKICLPIYYSLNDWKLMINNRDKYVIFVREESKIVIGYILAEKQDNKYHILSFGVLPKLRSLGVGKQLIQNLIDFVKKTENIKIISLNVHSKNKNAISFYVKNGFQTQKTLKDYYVGTNFSDTKDAYHMVKELHN